MTTALGARGDVYNSDLGCFISQAHQNFAEILHDYNPYLSLVFIPPKDRSAEDTKPYAVLYSPPSQAPQIVRYATEVEMNDPAALLGEIWAQDSSKVDVLGRIEAQEAAREAMRLKDHEARIEDEMEFLMYMAKTPLHTFHHNGQRYDK